VTTHDTGVPPPLSDDVIAVTTRLSRGFSEILGDAVASFFLYGAVAFPRPEGWKIDFDFHVLLHRALAESERAAITDLYAAVGARSELGRDLDGYFVLLADAGGSVPPRHQLDPTIRDEAWALHRAHVLAGRYFVVTGIDPREIVAQPSWAELDAALRAETAFVATHPDAPAFGILNGARILYSFATRNVVVSKYHAGQWALDSLPGEWHDGVRAALRFYSRTAAEGDDLVFAECWAPFVAYVKRSLPLV
jgi:Domain of unknown function (DUF4111)